MKNKILKTITGVAAVLAIFSVCAADSAPLVAMIGLLISNVWLVPFFKINEDVINRDF